MVRTIVVPDLLDTLPFNKTLTWERFQTLCTDILYKTYKSVDSREYLLKGSKQHGIDAYSVPKGEEKLTVAQCKLKDYISPKEVLDIIDEFLRGDLVSETKTFFLCTSADLGRQRDEAETISAARSKLGAYGIDFVVWDERGLSKELRTNPSTEIISIVYRYFNEEIALAFYGNIWTDFVKKLRKVRKHRFEKPFDYIPREVMSYSDSLNENENALWTNWNRPEKLTLSKLIEGCLGKENKKIVLLSTAGFGKTEELKMVAGCFSPDEKLPYPITFSLRDYNGQPIEEILSAYDPDWQNIEQEHLLLLLDGLDEIAESLMQRFVNHLNSFFEQNPKANAVVSSRYNFYDVRHPQLRGFELLLLKPLSHSDIQHFLLEKLGPKKKQFENLLDERNFSEYVNSPYYLTRFVRFFNEGNSFPRNKTELFERILFERLDNDEERYNNPEMKGRLLLTARQIAFCMTVTGKSSLTDDDMKVVVPDPETRKQLKHFGILNRNSTGVGTWAYEHKNLQEYLCASVFAHSGFVEIHKVVSSEISSNKLLPRYINTISFLFELVHPKSALFQELFTWINKNEPELLVRFEKEQIMKETRLEIFKGIFDYYKKQKITLRVSVNFSPEELACFVEIDEIFITYAASQVEEGLAPNLLYDLISILENTKRAFRFREKLIEVLFGILQNYTAEPFIVAKAINALNALGFNDSKTFDDIINSGIDVENYEVRNALLYFLSTVEYFEHHSTFILKSIPLLEEGQRKTNSSMSFTILKLLILKFEASAKIKEIFQYCLTNKSWIGKHGHYRDFHFDLGEVKTLLEKATTSYSTEPSILSTIYRLYCGIKYLSFEPKWFELFKTFFGRTCGTRTIFQKFYQYDKKQQDIMSFADEWCCDYLIEEYQAGKITNDQMMIFRNNLSHNNWELFLYFYNKLKDLGNGIFLVDTANNYIKLYEQQEERNQKMLLDQKLFLEEAEIILAIINKEQITAKDLWYSENEELRGLQNSLVLFKIREMCIHHNRRITKDELLDEYKNPENWKWLVINSTVDLLKANNKKPVHTDLVTNLEFWCKDTIARLNFENCIEEYEDGAFSYNRLVEFVKVVFLLLDLELDDNLLLKMLPADYESFNGWNDNSRETISSVITEQVKDKELLQKTVIENIRKGNLSILVLCSHFTICYKMGYQECLGDLYMCITSHPQLKDYNRVKLTDYYLDLGGEITDFAQYLAVPEVQKDESAYSSWHWYLLEKFQDIETAKSVQILLEVLNGDASKVNRVKAAEHLIQLSKIEGLKYWEEHVKKYKKWPFEHKWSSLQEGVAKMPAEQAIEIFLSVMEFAYENKLQDGFAGYHFIEESINGSLINLAAQNNKYYKTIKDGILAMIAKFLMEPFVDSIKFYSERFTQRYYENQKQEVDIQTANLIYQQAFARIS